MVEELQRAGVQPHLAEPADTSTLRGPKHRAKTDQLDARHLRELLAGSRRDYRAAHTMKVCMARGTVLVARFGPSQPTLPGLRDAASTGRPARQGTRSTRRRKMTCTGTPSGSSTDDRAEGLLAELEGGPDGDHRRA